MDSADLNFQKRFFWKRTLSVFAIIFGFVGISALASGYISFDIWTSLGDIPAGFGWMAANFVPNAEAFGQMHKIMPALMSTILVSIAASCSAAVLAFILAVLGSNAVGVGGPVSFLVRAIASLFRNIPIVAWALVLLFSFKQSEFTGYLALFLGSFGYLTRCYLESIDEVSAGSVEALRATGANYFQVVAQGVIPMAITAVISWVLYMIETNIREATLVGMLTGSGIGMVFDLYYKTFRYPEAGLVVLMTVLAVIACEMISNFVRRRVL